MKKSILLISMVLLSSCASADKACRKMGDRLSVIEEFCNNLVDQVAAGNCAHVAGKPEFSQCYQLIAMTVTQSCLIQAGYGKVKWSQSEFCGIPLEEEEEESE